MINTSKLNKLQLSDFKALKQYCRIMSLANYSNFDIVAYLEEYLNSLSDTVDGNYYKAVVQLKYYYYELFINEIES